MKMNRVFAVLLCIALLSSFTVSIYAGGHHGGGNHQRKIVWHGATNAFDGHYNHECDEYDHNNGANDYNEHCSDRGVNNNRRHCCR